MKPNLDVYMYAMVIVENQCRKLTGTILSHLQMHTRMWKCIFCVLYIGVQPLQFSPYSDIQLAFEHLIQQFVQVLRLMITLEECILYCRQYCLQSWNDENLSSSLCGVSSMPHLFNTLKSSSFFNFLNPKLLMHLATRSGAELLVTSVINYV